MASEKKHKDSPEEARRKSKWKFWAFAVGGGLLSLASAAGAFGFAMFGGIGIYVTAALFIGSTIGALWHGRKAFTKEERKNTPRNERYNALQDDNLIRENWMKNSSEKQQINSQNANKEGSQQEQVDGKHVENQQDTGREKSGDKKDAENLILETSKNVSLISARNQNSNQNQKTKVYTKEEVNAMSSSKGGRKPN